MRLHEALGRADVALELARDGVRHDPGSADARLILGMALEADGQLARGGARAAAGRGLRARQRAPRAGAGAARTLNRQASDSLRAVFAADSAAARAAAPARPRAALPPCPRGSRPCRTRCARSRRRGDSLFLPAAPDSR